MAVAKATLMGNILKSNSLGSSTGGKVIISIIALYNTSSYTIILILLLTHFISHFLSTPHFHHPLLPHYITPGLNLTGFITPSHHKLLSAHIRTQTGSSEPTDFLVFFQSFSLPFLLRFHTTPSRLLVSCLFTAIR